MNKTKIIAGFLAGIIMIGGSATFFLAQAAQSNSNVSVSPMVSTPKPSVSIKNTGSVDVEGAVIVGISGSTITATTALGSGTLTWIVNTTGSTKLLRRYDAASSVTEFASGDTIGFTGTLAGGSGLIVNATQVKDWSIQERNATFSGTVASVNASAQSFVMNTTQRGTLTVTVSGSTKLTEGSSTTASFADIQVGGKVEASGVWDTAMETLAATSVKIAAPASAQTIFQGTVSSVSTSNGNSLVMASGNTNYTVNASSGTSILNNLWLNMPFTNIQNGDHIRVYGALETNVTNTIDATVIRDTNR